MNETENSFELPEEPGGKSSSAHWYRVRSCFSDPGAHRRVDDAWKSRSQGEGTGGRVMEKELDADRAALENQKEKVAELTRQLDTLKLKIQTGETPTTKQAVTAHQSAGCPSTRRAGKIPHHGDGLQPEGRSITPASE